MPLLGADRHDRLVVELETLLLERARDPRDPLHLLMALGRVAFLVDVNAVAAEILRDVAGDVGGAHQRRHALAAGLDRNDADAHADLQRVVAPREAERRDRLAQRLGDLRSPQAT